MNLKQVPQDLDAEKSVLGSLILYPESYDQIVDIISSDDFFDKRNETIFNIIKELQKESTPIDIITVMSKADYNNLTQLSGGKEYIIDLMNRTISSANIDTYAKLIKDASLLRMIINKSTSFIEKTYQKEFTSVEHFINEVESEVLKISESKNSNTLSHVREIISEMIQNLEVRSKSKNPINGLETGLPALDSMTSGLQQGELIIIAARPSMGKTAFSLNLAANIIKQKKAVAYFSLEMSKASLMTRLLSSLCSIDLSAFKSGIIANELWPKIIQTSSMLSESNLYIDDSSSLSPLEIRSKCRRLKKSTGLDCVIIDYIQLIDLKQKVESRQVEVSEISKSLKAMAKELQVPVIALAQLNRGVEQRAEKRPMLSDLRESGSIEQDADVIGMLYREEYYERENIGLKGKAELIIGKQRNGPTGTVNLFFDAKYNKFSSANQ
jgi:replicative DNA helicase